VERVSEVEAVQSQLDGLYEEIRALASKRPNDAVNKYKLGVVNSVLRRTNTFLAGEMALEGFEQFSEDAVPTNSDVLLVLSQYLSFLEKMRSDNIQLNHGTWYWVIDGELSGIQTSPPRKLGR